MLPLVAVDPILSNRFALDSNGSSFSMGLPLLSNPSASLIDELLDYAYELRPYIRSMIS